MFLYLLTFKGIPWAKPGGMAAEQALTLQEFLKQQRKPTPPNR